MTGVELLLRAEARADSSGPEAMRLLHTPSEVYGWEPRRGFAGRIEGTRITINRDRQRGVQPTAPMLPGQKRVLMLGDSIAFGWGVHDEQTFSALLDRDPRLSVVNLAVEGYGPDQSLLKLEREGLAHRPHVVVLHFCLANDFVDGMLPAFLYDGLTPKPYFRLEGGELRLYDRHLRRSFRERAAAALDDRFVLVRRLRPPVEVPPHPDAAHWSHTARAVLSPPGPAVSLTLALVERMAAVSRARGAELVVLVHPNRRAFRGEDRLADELLRPGRLPGIRVVDLRARYRQRGLAFGDMALDAVGHLSPTGHREVASLLREIL